MESQISKFSEKANREAELKAEELYGYRSSASEKSDLTKSRGRRSLSRNRGFFSYKIIKVENYFRHLFSIDSY